jgi:hypothetical protein
MNDSDKSPDVKCPVTSSASVAWILKMSVAFAAPRVSCARPLAAGARPNVAAKAKAGNWLPGAESPSYLDGTLPGDYGFDPLRLVRALSRLSRLVPYSQIFLYTYFGSTSIRTAKQKPCSRAFLSVVGSASDAQTRCAHGPQKMHPREWQAFACQSRAHCAHDVVGETLVVPYVFSVVADCRHGS